VLVTKYFVYVGSSVLAALLFVAELCFLERPALFPDHSQIVDKTIIRIKSARKWPAKVVLDTSLPAIQPPAGEVSQIAQPAPRSPDEGTEKEKLDAFAELKSVALAEDCRPTVRAKHMGARVSRSNYVARFPIAKRLALKARDGCCQSERTDRRVSSSGVSRRRVVRAFGFTCTPVWQLSRPLTAALSPLCERNLASRSD
jgi:hypothetical protein